MKTTASSLISHLTLLAGVAQLDAFTSISASITRQSSLVQCRATAVDTSFMWNAGLNFGKGQFKFYTSFEEWMKPFPKEDRAEFPEVFNLPKGVYEVGLRKPLGVVFEEIDYGKGLYVKELVEDGNAALDGRIQPNDVLVGITAVKIVGAKYERRLIPCRNFDFDTMVGAVSSNEPKWGCNDVVLLLERPAEANSAQVQSFMEFFEPPFDNPWKQQQ
ncbi:hypothetical protein ACA910_021151 [Epithemia clementina (nom. ined.)]